MGREHARGRRLADQEAAAAGLCRRAVFVGEQRWRFEGTGDCFKGLCWVLRDFLIMNKGVVREGVLKREREKREKREMIFF